MVGPLTSLKEVPGWTADVGGPDSGSQLESVCSVSGRGADPLSFLRRAQDHHGSCRPRETIPVLPVKVDRFG